jgi:hypothetical protein
VANSEKSRSSAGNLDHHGVPFFPVNYKSKVHPIIGHESPNGE